MDTIVIGTGNPHKAAEIRRILAALPVSFPGLDQYPGAPGVEEDGETFEANAGKKALELAQALGLPVMADDSGLEVDALGGRPGVTSARYAGEEGNAEKNMDLLLEELAPWPEARDRTARFVCAVALAEPGRLLFSGSGTTEGRILPVREGSSGFGYDPVFFSADLEQSFGRAGPDEKNRVSHRGRAFRKLKAYLQS